MRGQTIDFRMIFALCAILFEVPVFSFSVSLRFLQNRMMTQIELFDSSRTFPSMSILRASLDDKASSMKAMRKKKKNKYAQFSKVDKVGKDPLEALMEESTQKLQKLEKDSELRKKSMHEVGDAEKVKRLEFPDNKGIDPYDPSTFGYVEIGTITGPHGVHGWTKVKACTDFPERLTRVGMSLHLKPLRKRAPRKITLATGKQIQTDSFLIQIQGVYNRTAAENLKGATLYYATQQDTVAGDDDLLVSSLVGLEVFVENMQLVGVVKGVVLAEEMCAIPGLGHDMLEVEIVTKDKQVRHQSKNLVLVPLVPDIVPKIDLSEKTILLTPPPGLLDLTYIREEKVRIKALLPPARD